MSSNFIVIGIWKNRRTLSVLSDPLWVNWDVSEAEDNERVEFHPVLPNSPTPIASALALIKGGRA